MTAPFACSEAAGGEARTRRSCLLPVARVEAARTRVVARRHFTDALARVGSPAAPLPMAGVRDALRAYDVLLLLAGSLALEADNGRAAQAGRWLDAIERIDLARVADEMTVACLALGLVAFEDVAGAHVDAAQALRLRRRIRDCGQWLDQARRTRAFGARETAGTLAWNHSLVASLALAACALGDGPGARRTERIEFGLARFAGFLEHGVNAAGIPYEGLFYWGLCLRTIGLFGLLAAGDAVVSGRFGQLRERHASRLARTLDWIDAASFPGGGHVLSYNHSPYTPQMAIQGLLLVFGESHPEQAASLWSRLLGTPTLGDASAPARDDACAFEFLFFGAGNAPATTPFARAAIVDRHDGWVLLQAPACASKLFVKSSTHLVGPHNQADANHFSAFLEGFPVFIDAGARRKLANVGPMAAAIPPSETGGGSSYGHNAILIDGRGQGRAGNGAGVSGQLLRCEHNGDTWMVTACAQRAYSTGRNAVAHALRHFVFHAGPSPFLFVFDDIRALDGKTHIFQRLLHLPQVEAMTQAEPLRTLQLRFRAATYRLRIESGAVAQTWLTLRTQPIDGPFDAMSTLCDTVVATNPYFWLLATPDSSPVAIRATRGGDAWNFEIDHPQGPRSIHIGEHSPRRAGVVAVDAPRADPSVLV